MGSFALAVADSLDDAHVINSPEYIYSVGSTELLCSAVLNGPQAWISFHSTIPPLALVTAATLSLTFATATAAAPLRITAIAHWTDLTTKPTGAAIATANYTVAAHGELYTQTFDVSALILAAVAHAGYTGAGRICLKLDGVSPSTVEHSIVSWDGGDEYTWPQVAVTTDEVDLAALQGGLYARFLTDAGGLKTALGGRLACAELPSDAALPSAVYSVSDHREDYTEGVTIEYSRVTFRIFTKDDPDGSAALALASKLRQCFDWAQLTFASSYLIFWMRPDVSAGLVALEDPGRQMFVQEYELAAQK